ncbi:hypothetical protein AV530_019838 [Patagioenas fasciata monilis]|uniref:Uncharacterized protein n=1 Tax=Patagioenas fasciata monilis TaxID=372326 RepID=A0A1V4JTD8_PATFA|nr:hypothetical protein AV530_019838 [Patagioenas fasciata monilis]
MLGTVYRLPASHNAVNFTTSAAACILVRQHGACWDASTQHCRSRACSVRGDREQRICGKVSEFPHEKSPPCLSCAALPVHG